MFLKYPTTIIDRWYAS